MNELKISPTIVCFGLFLCNSQHGTTPNQLAAAEQTAQAPNRNEVLSREIIKLFGEDQKLLQDFEDSKKDPALARTFDEHKARVLKTHADVFYDGAIKELWASEPGAPESLRTYVVWRKATTERLKAIIVEHGWPRRSSVGDEAAAAFFFLFGHADTSNAWRRTQLKTIQEVFETDRFNPRLYAHLCDRIESVDGKPQVFGSVMGPGKEPGSAKLYRPVIDNVEAVDKRRAQIGLPSIEHDLEKFRKGATIGPYMTPLAKDAKEWTLAEVYGRP
jgi:hypothetical protein